MELATVVHVDSSGFILSMVYAHPYFPDVGSVVAVLLDVILPWAPYILSCPMGFIW